MTTRRTKLTKAWLCRLSRPGYECTFVLNESVVDDLDDDGRHITQLQWVERALSVLYYNVGSWIADSTAWDVLDQMISISALNEKVYLLLDTKYEIREVPCVTTADCFKIDTGTD